MFGFNSIHHTETSVDVQEGYLVITKTGVQSKDGLLSRYEEKIKYTIKDGLFIEVKE